MQSSSPDSAVLFFDVDGTIIDHDAAKDTGDIIALSKPTDAVYDAFRRLRENGHQTFICSGRARDLIAPPLLELGPTGVVSSAGACVTIGDEVVREQWIDEEILIETIEEFIKVDAAVLLEGLDGCVALTPRGVGYETFPVTGYARTVDDVRAITPRMRYCKFSFTDAEYGNVIKARPFLEKYYKEYTMGIGFGEFAPYGVDKGLGVRRTLEALGHGRKNTFAFGDSENDLPMFPAVETPVAMGNAMPQVKREAVYITDSVADDGVVTALEHFGLI